MKRHRRESAIRGSASHALVVAIHQRGHDVERIVQPLLVLAQPQPVQALELFDVAVHRLDGTAHRRDQSAVLHLCRGELGGPVEVGWPGHLHSQRRPGLGDTPVFLVLLHLRGTEPPIHHNGEFVAILFQLVQLSACKQIVQNLIVRSSVIRDRYEANPAVRVNPHHHLEAMAALVHTEELHVQSIKGGSAAVDVSSIVDHGWHANGLPKPGKQVREGFSKLFGGFVSNERSVQVAEKGCNLGTDRFDVSPSGRFRDVEQQGEDGGVHPAFHANHHQGDDVQRVFKGSGSTSGMGVGRGPPQRRRGQLVCKRSKERGKVLVGRKRRPKLERPGF